MRKLAVFSLVIALGGCGLIQTSARIGPAPTAPTGPTSSNPTNPTNPTSERAPASEPAVPAGKGQIVMPNLVGMTEEQASAAVKRAGFALDMESRMLDCENPPKIENQIDCQDPDPGKAVSSHALVQVSVYHSHLSQGGKDKLLMDGVVGMTPAKATEAIKQARPNWNIKITPPMSSGGGEVYDAKCGANKVCSYELAGDPAVSGSAAILYVNRVLKVSAPPP